MFFDVDVPTNGRREVVGRRGRFVDRVENRVYVAATSVSGRGRKQGLNQAIGKRRGKNQPNFTVAGEQRRL